MDRTKDALLRLVKAGLSTKKIQEAYLNAGMDDNALFEIYGNILDAIYFMIGEHTQTFDESVTHIVMTAPILSDERRAEMLYSEFKKNHPEQPSPSTMEHVDVKKMYAKFGGYMTPEGDWQ